ncbi:hypothetical protein [uncultured Azohydromonas sp.]|jgi:hypothetical protein|uniref:hypothetical protein n=1 Tax=uncultured Azohydromonas sp. TaxID=487342 RepID=UPI0026023275|nr:hypothetical protein [uncultured Azohydromonas sp.]
MTDVLAWPMPCPVGHDGGGSRPDNAARAIGGKAPRNRNPLPTTMQTNFADAIINITVTGPLVRLDLGTVLSQTKDGKQELLATPTQQLVMPLDGFLRAFGMQKTVVDKLIADGVIKPQPSPAPAAA